ncbi:MAG: gamma carbonic anhydrase family protein [Nitrospirae bacterium]|nr:gamma carbonic anhydrase family protein [Nitrospirota bacterium]
MIREFNGIKPRIHPEAYVDEAATVIGEVELASGASAWPGAVLRGDMGSISIGKNSSVQDNASCHCTKGEPGIVIGENVSVGHGAVLHGCRVGDNCVIGMKSVIMDGAEIGEWSIVAAGAVVTQGKKFPSRSVIAGIPAKVMKEADEATLNYIKWNAGEYEEIVRIYRRES